MSEALYMRISTRNRVFIAPDAHRHIKNSNGEGLGEGRGGGGGGGWGDRSSDGR